ncbi:MAG: bifunctional lysylphosphatidylglycerol flippase/synthetase MprF, partial [Gammaproteobacteria bacterium]
MADANEIAQAMTPPSRGQRVLMPLLSAALFLAASSAIYHLLQEMDANRMFAELRQYSPGQLGLALLLTAASYTVLIGYDWSALRYIGRAVALRTVAYAAFCGCAIANTVGVNIVSGGSVRYRIYVPAGLGALDVAQVTFFGMIAYGIGNFVLGAAALTLHPGLIGRFLPVSPGLLHGLGVSALALFGTLTVLFFFRRAPLRIGRWRFRLPSGRVAMAQLFFTLADIVFAGGCLYVLLNAPDVPFIAFLAVYSIATLAGMVSHVPGGLGVFESI